MVAAVGEDVGGTAPHAVSWIGVSDAAGGRWPRVPRRLSEALAGHSVRAVAIRAVARPPAAGAAGDGFAPGVILVGTLAGRTWRRDVPAEDAASAIERLATDPAVVSRLAVGVDPGIGRPNQRNAVLICSDAARDACCGQLGPPAAAATARRFAGPARRSLLRRTAGTDVFECSHLGGHRFAPNALVLPWGIVLGGLGPEPEALVEAVAGVFVGKPLVEGYRGRSSYPVHVQAAEAAARRHLAVVGTNAGPDDLLVHGSDPVGSRVPEFAAAAVGADGAPDGEPVPEGAPEAEQHLVRLQHTGGRTIRVLVTRVRTDARRPLSCGGPPEPVDVWVTRVDADPPTGLWFGTVN